MNKMIISMLMLLIALGMIGTASAMPATANIIASSFNVGGGNVDSSIVDITDINYKKQGNLHTRYLTVVTSNSNIQARVYNPSNSSQDTDWVSTNDPMISKGFTYTATSPNDYTFTIEVKGTDAGEVTVYDNSGTSYAYLCGFDKAGVSRGVDIPEFPTVALPIAAILGLMFIISSRKKEE